MYYDLNVPWTTDYLTLQRTLVFLSELDYNVVALNHIIHSKLPGDLACPIPNPLPFAVPAKLKILRRATLVISDATQNHRLSSLSANYDIVALRPTDEKMLQLACQSLECELISLDLSVRYPFFFKIKMICAAVARGVRIELAYGAALGDAGDAVSRRNVITNATGVLRAARGGRGIVISSEATRALACRAPADVVNLAAIWGLSQERGHEAVTREARAVVAQAEMKRRSFRGVIDVVYGGEQPPSNPGTKSKQNDNSAKRKAASLEPAVVAGTEIALSKREKKRRAKAARDAVSQQDTLQKQPSQP